MDINRVTLLGYVVHSPKNRHLPSGDLVARFAVATNAISRDPRSGIVARVAQFHDVVAWRRLAEVAVAHVTSGMRIYVEGRLQHRKFTKRNGATSARTEIVVSQMVLLGSKPTATASPLEGSSPNAS